MREAFGTRSASALPYTTQNPDDNRAIAKTTTAPHAQEANTNPASTGNTASSVAPLRSAPSARPYETPQVCRTQAASNEQASNRSEPSSTRAMDSLISLLPDHRECTRCVDVIPKNKSTILILQESRRWSRTCGVYCRLILESTSRSMCLRFL